MNADMEMSWLAAQTRALWYAVSEMATVIFFMAGHTGSAERFCPESNRFGRSALVSISSVRQEGVMICKPPAVGPTARYPHAME